MKQEYHNRIVKKSDEIEIGQFNDSDEYIITHKRLGNRIVINQKTLDILNLIDNETPLATVVSQYNTNSSSALTVEIAHKLLYGKLGKQGIIITENVPVKKKELNSYLYLSFTLINKKNLEFFTRKIAPLFSFKHFYKILFFSFAIVFYTVVSNHSKIIASIGDITLTHWFLFILIRGGILFLHEFGHATACKKLGAEPGNIGFGFYLLSPVMFADVSDIWKLKSYERNYVNFAGLYVEILVAFTLSIIYLFFLEDISLLIINYMILFSFILNLNPLLRYDGYWILSDTINTPNLRKVSMQKLKMFIRSIFKKKKLNFTGKDVFLTIYAFTSVVFIFFFLAIIFIKDPNSLIAFPINFYNYIKALIAHDKPFVTADLAQFILPLIFYFIIIKLVVSFSISRKHKRKVLAK